MWYSVSLQWDSNEPLLVDYLHAFGCTAIHGSSKEPGVSFWLNIVWFSIRLSRNVASLVRNIIDTSVWLWSEASRSLLESHFLQGFHLLGSMACNIPTPYSPVTHVHYLIRSLSQNSSSGQPLKACENGTERWQKCIIPTTLLIWSLLWNFLA